MSKFAGLGLAVEQPHRVTLSHPVTRKPLTDREGKQAYIDILSTDSPAARAWDRKFRDRRIRMRGRMSAEEQDANNVDLLAHLTRGWYLVDLDGNPLPVEFSEENARLLYDQPEAFWLTEQVNDAAGDRANFTKPSSTS